MPFGIKLKKVLKYAAYATAAYFGGTALATALAPEAAVLGGVSTDIYSGVAAGTSFGGGAAAGAGAVAGTAAGAGAAAAGGITLGQMAGLTAGSQVLGSVLAPKAQSVSDVGALADLQRQTTKLAPMPAVVGAKERARAEQSLLRKSGMNRASTLLSDTLG